MKTTHFLLTQAATVAEAVTLMKEEINREYNDKNAMLQNIFILPELQRTALADGKGQQQISYNINLVAVMVEEPEWDNLQRNYKEIFDLLVTERESIIPTLTGLINGLKSST